MFSGKWPNGGGIYVGDGVNSPDIDLNYKWNISANGVFLEVWVKMHNILAKKKTKSAMIVVHVPICRHDHFIYFRIVYQHVSADNLFAIKNYMMYAMASMDVIY